MASSPLTSEVQELEPTSTSTSLLARITASTADYIVDVSESVATHSVGQYLFRKADGFLWAVEKSLQWSVTEEAKETLTADKEVALNVFDAPVRPLPWVFFIPLLLMIRGVRMCMQVFTWASRRDPVTPKDMVRWVQVLRRHLRVIKFRGQRNAKRLHHDVVVDPAAHSANGADVDFVKKRKFSDIEPHSSADETENTEQKLVRLAREDVDDMEADPNFQPDSSVESDSTTSSDDEQPLVDVVDEESEESSTMSASVEEVEVDDNLLTGTRDQDKFHSPAASEEVMFASTETSESLRDASLGSEISDRSTDSAMRMFSNMFAKKDKKAQDNSV